MLAPGYKKLFKKDFKRMGRRGKNLNKIERVMEMLWSEMALDERYRDHALVGNYGDFRECHIEPDWLLIYRVDAAKKQIIFERTGTHTDLFR